MNPEQNAKAYEMALEAARKELGVDRKECEVVQQVLCDIFPELAESDNERIRHWLIGLISADYKDDNFPSGIKKTDVLNWLKKESVVYEQGMYYYDGKKFLYCQQEKPKVAIPTLDSVKQNKSDDKRILASIADCVGLMGEDGDVFSNHNVTKVQVFSWLEKQNAQKSSIEEILTKAGLKPYKDGNQWCILAGDNIQEGICGFGDTINEALYQFLMEVLEKQKVLIAIPDELVKNYKHFCEIGCREAAMLINAINGISEQKEQKSVEWTPKDWNMLCDICGYISGTGSSSGITNKERETWLRELPKRFSLEDKEQKPVPIKPDDKHMLERIMELVEFCNDKEIIWNWLCEKVKEQKPLTTEETELNSIAFLEQMGYTCIPPGKEQNPAEWSEVDEDCLKRAIWYVENPAPTVVKNTNLVLWLQSLPERFNLQSKEEWSKEDEEIFNNIIEKAKGGHWIEVNEITWLITRFKSFRPQYHGDVTMTEAYKMGFDAGKASSWKPSEEQMEVLLSTQDMVRSSGYRQNAKVLASLYEQLKRLM